MLLLEQLTHGLKPSLRRFGQPRLERRFDRG
jgi:hypothetical protein